MTPESQLLITLTRIAVTGKPEPVSLEVDWDAFLRLAREHKLAGLAYDGLKKSGVALDPVPEKILVELRNACMRAIAQSVQQDAMRCRLEAGLLQRNVDHIFLKGSVLKYDYPVSALRTMSDMDILAKVDDYDALDEIMLELGGQHCDGDGNHRSFLLPGNLQIEFHPNLLHHDTPVGTEINPGWQYAKPSDTCAKQLTEEGFYLHTICHLASHFTGSGCGIRLILDIWVFHHLRKAPLDREFVEKEFARFGMLDFARNIEALTEHWFSCAEGSPLLDELGEYVITSGLYGTQARHMLNAVSLSENSSKSSALMGQVFRSRAEMEDRFPWVKGKPWLLPVAWCVRAFRVVTKRSDLLVHWVKGATSVSDDEISQQKALLDRFGIRKKIT